MTPDERKVETQIAELGLNAPRITAQHIDGLMQGVTFNTHHVPGTTTVLATAVMPSGFTLVTAEAACVSPDNFRLATGIELAISKAERLARDALWKLEGYRLSQMLHEIRQDRASRALSTMRAAVEGGRGSSPGPLPGTGG